MIGRPEPDFSRISLKINAAGSWCNCITFPVEREPEVMAACVVLFGASGGRVKFKLTDAEGGQLALLGGREAASRYVSGQWDVRGDAR